MTIGALAGLAMIAASAALAGSNGTTTARASGPCTAPGDNFVLIKTKSSKKACSPADAPQRVKDAVQAANRIRNKPYCYGGGHGGWAEDNCYDCSGAVSYALHGGDWLSYPHDSGGFMHWGEGESKAFHEWIKIYANAGHVWMKVRTPQGGENGIRWDTSDTGGTGPSWHNGMRSGSGYKIRHPKKYS
jgi:hypothetical protein